MVGALLGFALLAVVAHARVPQWPRVVAGNLAVAVGFVGLARLARRSRDAVARFFLRTAAVSLALGYLFGAVAPLQLLLHGRWLDGPLVALEQRLLGVEPVLWAERFVTPWLTEWMMLCYVGYLALYPLVSGVVWAKVGEAAAEECLLGLALANVACDVGFILAPVAGPHYFLAGAFTVPLEGGLFTRLGELIRVDLQFPGGSLPSPHCAAATVLWAAAWRGDPRLGAALTPVVLTLYASTVYGRYHYLSDAVAGILTAAAVLVAVPRLVRGRRSAPA